MRTWLFKLTLLSLVLAFTVPVYSSPTVRRDSSVCVNLLKNADTLWLSPGEIPPPKKVSKYKTTPILKKYEGEGRWHFLEDKSRSRVTYFRTERQREPYRVFVKNGLLYKTTGELLDTGNSKQFLLVMDDRGNFYVGHGVKSKFYHSSFMAGGPIAAGAMLRVNQGVLVKLRHSTGHYATSENMFTQAVAELYFDGLNVENVVLIPWTPQGSDDSPPIKWYQLPPLP